MRFLLVTLVFVLGCSGPTTPAGPLPTVDLRQHIKAANVPAEDAKGEKHEAPLDVHGVKMKIVWYTWADGPHKYILSARWEVVTPAKGVSVVDRTQALGLPMNTGSVEAVVERVGMSIWWSEEGPGSTSGGSLTVYIDANGKLT